MTLPFRLVAACLMLALAPVVPAGNDLVPQASAIVLLEEDRLPPMPDFRQRFDAAVTFRETRRDGAATGFIARVHGGIALVIRGSAALDERAVREACTNSLNHRQVCEAVAARDGHALVVVAGTDLDPLDAHLLHTRVVSALLDDNALAVYRGGTLLARNTYRVLARGASREAPPAWLWVDMRITRSERGIAVATLGLTRFGLLEIETRDVLRDSSEVFDLIRAMASYLIKNGAVIEDGETVGDSTDDNIVVRKAPSFRNEGETVYRVEYR